jgi:hypothetical protein
MLLTLTLLFFISVLVLALRQRLGRRGWILLGTAALAFSILFAFFSVSSMWESHMDLTAPLTAPHGLDCGAKIWSFPLSLSMTPQATLMNILPFEIAVKLTVTFASLTILEATCIYSGNPLSPKIVRIDFPIFNTEDAFYDFLIAVFTFFNIIGAMLGIELGRLAMRIVASKTLQNKS